jgi:hypothetical protein
MMRACPIRISQTLALEIGEPHLARGIAVVRMRHEDQRAFCSDASTMGCLPCVARKARLWRSMRGLLLHRRSKPPCRLEAVKR